MAREPTASWLGANSAVHVSSPCAASRWSSIGAESGGKGAPGAGSSDGAASRTRARSCSSAAAAPAASERWAESSATHALTYSGSSLSWSAHSLRAVWICASTAHHCSFWYEGRMRS